MQKEKIRKIHWCNDKILLVITLFVIVIINLFWGFQKQGMFIDEIYSYGLSNGYYTPFIKNISEDDNLINKILTQEDLDNYITVSKNDAFKFDSVYYNQTQDVHPPLYYMLLHFCSSFFPYIFSKWIGLAINLILYLLTNLMLYKLGGLVLHNRKTVLVAVLVYGLSQAGLSTTLMVRMYLLLTLLSVCFCYCVVRLYQEENLGFYPLISLILFFGMLTQYYFVIFSFFISAVYCLNKIKKRKYKDVIYYAVFAIIGLICFYFVWPSVVDHLFADKLVSGKSAIHNLGKLKNVITAIYFYFSQIIKSYKLVIVLFIMSLIALFVKFKSTIVKYIDNFDKKDSAAIAIGVSVILTVLTVAVISPVYTLRYVYNILPMLSLVIVYFIETIYNNSIIVEKVKDKIKRRYITLYLIMVLIFSCNAFINMPDYIYPDHKKFNEIIENYKELPCVYLDDNYNAPLTQDLLQIKKFKNVFVTNDFFCDETEMYYQNSDDIVLYINVDKFWSSGFDSKDILNKIIINTEYKRYKKLYKNEFSETYLLKK